MKNLQTTPLHFKSFSIMNGIFHGDFPGHSHACNSFELHYVIDGIGELITEERTYKLHKNIVYITGPGKYHMQKTEHSNNMNE